MPALYCLFESASGYALLEAVESSDLSSLKAEVQTAVTDLARFSKMVKLKAFQVRGVGREGDPPAWRRPPPISRPPPHTHLVTPPPPLLLHPRSPSPLLRMRSPTSMMCPRAL